MGGGGFIFWFGVSDSSKLQIQKQITTEDAETQKKIGVSDSSKLQIQKQITTVWARRALEALVFPIVQSYKFKSKSQPVYFIHITYKGVSDSSKLQIQKQITTNLLMAETRGRCFR